MTVTATLSKTLSSDVRIPLTLTDKTAEPGDRGTLAVIFIGAGGTSASSRITTSHDDDSDNETFTVGLDADNLPSDVAGVIQRPITVTITDDEASGNGRGSGPYAALIAKVYEWRNDPRHVHDKAYTDRWDRALLAFGETVSDSSLTPMRAAEAQGYADRGWERWVEVAAALREIEGGSGPYAALIAKMYEWRNDPRHVHDKAYTDRWDRALLAFGETVSDSSLTPMSAAEAQGYADRGWERWVEVAAALREIEGGDNPVIVTKRGIARETDDAVVFTVRLGPAAVEHGHGGLRDRGRRGRVGGVGEGDGGHGLHGHLGHTHLRAGRDTEVRVGADPGRRDRRGHGVLPVAVLEPAGGDAGRPRGGRSSSGTRT